MGKKQDAGENQCTHQQDGGNHSPTASFAYRISDCSKCSCGLLLFGKFLEFFRRFRITELLGIKVNEGKRDAMFYFALTKIVQSGANGRSLEILGHPF